MNTMDRHFALLDDLKQEKNPDKQEKICLEDIGLADRFNQEWLQQHGKPLPKSYPSFKKLAVIYEKAGKFDEAIEVCKKAIAAGYKQDGTQGGMAARVRKLKEKKEKTK